MAHLVCEPRSCRLPPVRLNASRGLMKIHDWLGKRMLPIVFSSLSAIDARQVTNLSLLRSLWITLIKSIRGLWKARPYCFQRLCRGDGASVSIKVNLPLRPRSGHQQPSLPCVLRLRGLVLGFPPLSLLLPYPPSNLLSSFLHIGRSFIAVQTAEIIFNVVMRFGGVA